MILICISQINRRLSTFLCLFPLSYPLLWRANSSQISYILCLIIFLFLEGSQLLSAQIWWLFFSHSLIFLDLLTVYFMVVILFLVHSFFFLPLLHSLSWVIIQFTNSLVTYVWLVLIQPAEFLISIIIPLCSEISTLKKKILSRSVFCHFVFYAIWTE